MKRPIYLFLLCLAAPAAQAQNISLVPAAEVAQREAFDPGWTPGIYPAIEPTLGQDDEIFLLQESQPFFVRATTLQVYNTNAFYDFTEQSDWYFRQELDAGFETMIADRFFVLAEVGGSLTRYDKFGELDRDAVNLRVATSYALSSNASLGLAYTGSWYSGDDSGDGTQTPTFSGNGLDFYSLTNTDANFHALSLSGNFVRPLPSGNSFQWSPVLTRIWATPTDYSQTAIGLFSSVVAPLGQKTVFGLTGRVDYICYDDFYGTFFDGDRKDLSLSAGAYVACEPFENAELRLGAMFTNNDSTLTTEKFDSGGGADLYDFTAWQFVPTVKMTIHF